MWFTYPGGSPSSYVSISTGEPSKPRPSVQLVRDKKFSEFESLLTQRCTRDNGIHYACTVRAMRFPRSWLAWSSLPDQEEGSDI